MKNTLGLKGFRDRVKGMGLRGKFRELRYEIKFAIQRAWKGYDDTFWCNMDTTFIELFYHLLDEMIKDGMSHPVNLSEWEWNGLLKQMRDTLRRSHWEYEDYSTWNDIDFDSIKANRDEFFEMFSKYFYELWD